MRVKHICFQTLAPPHLLALSPWTNYLTSLRSVFAGNIWTHLLHRITLRITWNDLKNFLKLGKLRYLVFTIKIPNDRFLCIRGTGSWSGSLKSEQGMTNLREREYRTETEARNSLPVDSPTSTQVSFHPRWNVCISWVKIIINVLLLIS